MLRLLHDRSAFFSKDKRAKDLTSKRLLDYFFFFFIRSSISCTREEFTEESRYHERTEFGSLQKTFFPPPLAFWVVGRPDMQELRRHWSPDTVSTAANPKQQNDDEAWRNGKTKSQSVQIGIIQVNFLHSLFHVGNPLILPSLFLSDWLLSE